MIYREFEAETIFESEGALGKRLSVINNCEFVHLKIDEGKRIPAHELPIPVSFFVVKGTAELILDEKREKVAAGDMIGIEPGVQREWKNIGNERLELLVIKYMG